MVRLIDRAAESTAALLLLASGRWWRALGWRRLKPFKTFAALIERHSKSIAAYGQPQNTVALDLVEGLKNKIRGISVVTASATMRSSD